MDEAILSDIERSARSFPSSHTSAIVESDLESDGGTNAGPTGGTLGFTFLTLYTLNSERAFGKIRTYKEREFSSFF